jgi:hypothetical protein
MKFFGQPISFFVLVAVTSVVTSAFVVPFVQRTLQARTTTPTAQ